METQITIEDFFSELSKFTKTEKVVLVHPPTLLEYDKKFFNKLIDDLKKKMIFASAGITELSTTEKFVIDLFSDCY